MSVVFVVQRSDMNNGGETEPAFYCVGCAAKLAGNNPGCRWEYGAVVVNPGMESITPDDYRCDRCGGIACRETSFSGSAWLEYHLTPSFGKYDGRDPVAVADRNSDPMKPTRPTVRDIILNGYRQANDLYQLLHRQGADAGARGETVRAMEFYNASVNAGDRGVAIRRWAHRRYDGRWVPEWQPMAPAPRS